MSSRGRFDPQRLALAKTSPDVNLKVGPRGVPSSPAWPSLYVLLPLLLKADGSTPSWPWPGPTPCQLQQHLPALRGASASAGATHAQDLAHAFARKASKKQDEK